MTPSSELSAMVARLRHKVRRTDLETGGGSVSVSGMPEIWSHGEVWQTINPGGPAAADAIESLLADLETMQAALEPFAKALEDWGDDERHADKRDLYDHPTSCNITLGDLRKARAALQTRKAKP